MDASAAANDLQFRTLRLFDEFVTADGRGVDFAKMATSQALLDYLQVCSWCTILVYWETVYTGFTSLL